MKQGTDAKDELSILKEDIEDREAKWAEQLRQLTRRLNSLRKINRLIVYERSPQQLIQSACELLTEHTEYKSAWIALSLNQGNWDLFAESGFGDAFTDFKRMLIEGGSSYCCLKLKEMKETVLPFTSLKDCKTCPLYDPECTNNIMVAKITYENEVFGHLGITISDKIRINEDELSIMEEVAGDIGFALHDMKLRNDLKKANSVLQLRSNDLKERLKELNCLYRIDEIMVLKDLEEDEIYNGIIQIIQEAWQFPNITAVKIRVEDREYLSENFKKTKWLIKSDFHVKDEMAGSLEVYYTEKAEKNFNGPFLEEEILLLKNISHKIERYLDQKMKDEQIVSALERAENADKLKSSFLLNMSHEIRTPMNAIIGFSQLLGRGSLSKANQESYIDIIHKSGDRLLHLIDDILDIAKIETGAMKINYSKYAVKNLIEEAYISTVNLQRLNSKPDIKIRTNHTGDQDTVISIDKGRVLQIMTNLIDNALKFTDAGEIEIGYNIDRFISDRKKAESLDAGSDFIEFYVKDTGIGIPEDKYVYIFDRFNKIEDSSKLYEGTGLGLSISKTLVNMMGGDIWVESVVGIGSSFFFTLPYSPVKSADVESTSFGGVQKVMDSNLAKSKLLVVEDEESNYKFIEYGLENLGAEILWVKNGLQAVDLCRSDDQIDLVLMDMKMPVMDGFMATKEIRNFNTDLPIIAVTAYAALNEREAIIKAGCTDYISKPFDINYLIQKIGDHISTDSTLA